MDPSHHTNQPNSKIQTYIKHLIPKNKIYQLISDGSNEIEKSNNKYVEELFYLLNIYLI